MIVVSYSILGTSILLILIASLVVLFATIKERNFFVKLLCVEVFSNVFIMCIAIIAYIKNMPRILDVAIVVSLLVFLSTIAYCTILEKSEEKDVGFNQ